MATEVPNTMRAIALAHYCKPNEYDLADVPTPKITEPNEVLIKVHATSINPVDVKLASGMTKMLHSDQFPYKIGYDVARTVVDVGSAVTTLHHGDVVYTRVPNAYRGSVAEYALSTSSTTTLKPPSLSFAEAASIPLVGLISLQRLRDADEQLDGGLRGKVVLIPAGLSGTGIIAIQLAKNVFGAAKVVTTVSTGKLARAKAFFGEEGIEFVDYTKENLLQRLGKANVDCLFDTTGEAIKNLPLMKKGGVIVSISSLPSGTMMRRNGMPDMPWVMEVLLNAASWALEWWIGTAGVRSSFQFTNPDAHDLDLLAGWVAEGKAKPLVGRTAKLEELEKVRAGCQEVYDGKGGVGKFVIEIL